MTEETVLEYGIAKRQDAVVFVPVLNEQDAILSFLERWSKFDWDILLLDGMSHDNTITIINDFSKQQASGGETITLIRAEERHGLAFNTCLGLQAALNAGYRYVIVADVGTQRPADAWKMLESARQASPAERLIFRGSYFIRGSQTQNFPIYRRLVTIGARWVSWVLLGSTGTYPTHAFKVWPRQALSDIPFWGLVNGAIARCENGPEFQVGMTFLSLANGWSVVEFPMIFFGTKSTFRWRWIPKFVREVLRIRRYRPREA
ncbi:MULTISPECIES: glycosyltransferase [unclassified Bradyrhizobium]|uniref:glycosyltransferase n=1 Tax=unclassified Bradyrhizobium TaxID=2631580 RepID=UPI0028E50ADD|nr:MULTISPECIES: glycosyltransferase [unclassified Bradyrhizobium]